MNSGLSQRIARRAYELSKSGAPGGPSEFWLQAERELTGKRGEFDPAKVTELAGLLKNVSPSAGKKIADAVQLYRRSEVVIAFGGHCKTGKSTLVNAALGRNILPTNDLPETGVPCVIGPGNEDSAVVRPFTGPDRSIECNTGAIRDVVSLVSATGELRESITSKISHLLIKLKSCHVGPQVRWVDAPGINDTEEMEAAATRASDFSDLLVWVLNSLRMMADSELSFVAGHLHSHGPASVVFVVNVYLPQDTVEAWERFHRERLKDHLIRLRQKLAGLDQSPDAVDPVVVSARAVCGAAGEMLGGKELRRLVRGISSPADPRVKRVRSHRVLRTVESAVEPIETALRAEQRETASRRQQAQTDAAANDLNRGRQFLAFVDTATDQFISSCGNAITACGSDVAGRIYSSSLKRDGSYAAELKSGIQKAIEAELGKLMAGVAMVAAGTGHRLTDGGLIVWLRGMCSVGEISVYVPESKTGGKVGGGAAAGAAAGAVVGSVVPIFGTLLGAFVGGMAGAIGGGVSAEEDDKKNAAGAKSNVHDAARSEAANIGARRAAICNQIRKSYEQVPSNPVVENSTKETFLLQLLEKAKELVDELTDAAASQ